MKCKVLNLNLTLKKVNNQIAYILLINKLGLLILIFFNGIVKCISRKIATVHFYRR